MPASGDSKPAIIRSTVVLPEPDGPSIEKNSPSRMSRSTSSTAVTLPNVLVTPRRLTAVALASSVRLDSCGCDLTHVAAHYSHRSLRMHEPTLHRDLRLSPVCGPADAAIVFDQGRARQRSANQLRSTSCPSPVPPPRSTCSVSTDLLDDEEKAIRDTVRRFCDDRIRPEIADWFESGQIPARDLAKELGALGLLGMHLEGYGCAGTSATAYGLACLELEAADSGIRSLVSVQGSLAMYAIHRFGSDEQKDEWLPRMAAGEAIGCFGLTEPDFGSNPGGMRTRATRDGGDWVLNGTKMWITNGSVADVAVVWARTDDGIRGFVVPTSTPGFSAPEIKKKMSLRASVTSELVLEDVRLPESADAARRQGSQRPAVVPDGGAVRDHLRCCWARPATASRRRSRTRSRGRCSTSPLAAYQLTQAKLADMTLELGKGDAARAAPGADEGRRRSASRAGVSSGKLNNVREAIAIARECRTILAANGVTLEYPVIRHANNLESVLTYEGTSEVHQLVIGQALTGEAAFR